MQSSRADWGRAFAEVGRELLKDTLSVSKERANLFLYPLLEVHFPLERVASVRVCLRDVPSGLHPQSQPHPLQNRPQPGVRSQADPRQLFLHNLWITVTLSVPGGHLLPLENDIVSVTAPTTHGTKTSSHSDGLRGKVWHVTFYTFPPSRPACTRTFTLSPLWRWRGWDPCVYSCALC